MTIIIDYDDDSEDLSAYQKHNTGQENAFHFKHKFST